MPTNARAAGRKPTAAKRKAAAPPPFADLLDQHLAMAKMTKTELAAKVYEDRSMVAHIGRARAPRRESKHPREAVYPVPSELVEQIIDVLELSRAAAAEFRLAALLVNKPDALKVVMDWQRYRR